MGLSGSSRIVTRKNDSMLRSSSTSFGVTTLRTMLFLLWPDAQAMLSEGAGEQVQQQSVKRDENGPVNVVLDGARHVKVDDERELPDVAERLAQGVVDDEDALRREARTVRRERAEFGDGLLACRGTHLRVQREGVDRAAAKLVRDGLDRLERRRKDDGVLKVRVLAEVGERLELPLARAAGLAATGAGSLALRGRVRGDGEVPAREASELESGRSTRLDEAHM